MTLELVATAPVVDNHGEELLYLVAQALPVVAVEVLAVVVLVLVAHLEVVGEPPRRRYVDIALGA